MTAQWPPNWEWRLHYVGRTVASASRPALAGIAPPAGLVLAGPAPLPTGPALAGIAPPAGPPLRPGTTAGSPRSSATPASQLRYHRSPYGLASRTTEPVRTSMPSTSSRTSASGARSSRAMSSVERPAPGAETVSYTHLTLPTTPYV